MSNNWQPPTNANQNGNQPPPRTGGLLSNYSKNPSQQLPPGPPAGGSPSSQLVPKRSGLLSSYSQQSSAGGPQPPQRSLFANTMRVVRQWSGKLAAAARQQSEQPPAPYMELYRPSQSDEHAAIAPRRSRWRRSRAVRTAMLMRRRRERWARTHPNMNRVLSGALIGLALLLVIVSVSGSAYAYTYYQSQLPRLQQIASQTMSQSTRIYDRNGTLLYEVYNTSYGGSNPPGRRTPVSYNDIPQVLRDAQIDIEDASFWNNAGVDPIGILRSVVGIVQSSSIQGGGSTLAQQIIKNLTGNAEQKLERKIPEAALAIGLTQQYPKWKILEMYFNVVPYGTQDLGIEAAVEEYFHLMPQCSADFKCTPGIRFLNKDVENCQEQDKMKCPDNYILGLARASLLAGIPNNPTLYNPTNEGTRKYALERQKLVLQRMIDLQTRVDGLGVVTPAIAKQAEDLTANMKIYKYTAVKHAPHFVDWIVDQLASSLGNGDKTIGYNAFITGGFNIQTTASLELEEYVQNVITHHLADPAAAPDGLPLNSEAHNVNSSAAVVMNARTGEILAMIGSADYDNKDDPRVGGEFNIADPPASPDPNAQPPGRQTGSSFKPIVYATTFNMGWYPGMVIPDFHTNFPIPGQGAGAPAPQNEQQAQDGNYMYAPNDYDFATPPRWNYAAHGELSPLKDGATVTVRTSLQESLNVGAVKAMKYAGPENVANLAHRLGLTEIKTEGQGISWALGTQNSTVLQMTSVYQTFANNGKRIPPQGVLNIWDNYGHNLYHYDPANPAGDQVLSPQVSFLLTSVLRDEKSRINEFGRYHTLSFSDIDPACETNAECTHQVAAKTGTTNDLKDVWTVGYTPNVAVGVWSGNADNESMKNVLGISGAGTIWHSIIKTVSGYCNLPVIGSAAGVDDGVPCPPDGLPQRLGIGQDAVFTPPPGVIQAYTSNTTGLAPNGGSNLDWIIDGQQPQQAVDLGNNQNNNGR